MNLYSITTLGCKVNRYESEAISEQLGNLGWQAISKGGMAHVCIINTCTVTQKAAMQSRQAVRKIIRNHPGALVVVTGCYAQVAPEVFTSIPGVHFVIGNAFKDRIARLVSSHKAHGPAITLVEDLSAPRPFQDLPVTKFGNRTRPFLKIQDGCDAFCSYCVIPHSRGRSRSLPPEIAVRRISNLKEQGYAEVVLCGINLGRYGGDLARATSLLSLIRSIDGPQGVKRLRLSSIEPTEISEKLIRELASSKHVCQHLHIPLQSGDDDVLNRMNRSYNSIFYGDMVHHIVSVMPDVAIGIDVLVGFPGETEIAFENTFRLIKRLPVAYLHIFPFSVQKQTPAAAFRDPVPPETIKKRCQLLRSIGETKRRRFYEKAIGSTFEILIEGNRDKTTGYLKGLTKNYIPVFIEWGDELMHQVIEVRLTGIEHGKVFGERLL
ncbi:MAG: tRNA (N(6)-L-threonylcarbamoyladenosine(37)-C(2))-methylthiotransferase MtaB [Desulfobacterales bacterium C00003060]|nr:MAG: tRNA (N(6)-L-threonylcarbamoyladenosine(37)-C(2))-methylthiotransferase MtaB [Desulfobacterales bacterium S3730MH5]OEU78329.1 MAG: tRNA (N(6)-L-threonylcarbamoyladenosine(37)-C(2))-methylthiotransferase MtaB [Desulfobacterales bacterium S5133MH4]OEU81678.1 MAG: tRNA (N(6)-L-threonylcarbamoyladenosine(37)-C(2))-methylthiotransferase MtaB [Desulfobacterales bacterium C00003060]